MAFAKQPHIVDVRLIFMRLGQINTLSDQFDGEACLEIEWLDSNVIDEYDSTKHWNPKVYIYNALGELKQQITHKVRKAESGGTIICEQQNFKGAYYENLELNNFPVDVQDLTISITSRLTANEVLLRPHPHLPSRVNESAFLAKQQWKLFKCVNATVDSIHDEDTNQPRSMIHVTCHAQRIPTYFHWNGFFLIFIITLFCFPVWAIDPSLPQNRLALMATILLTSISFRSTITSKLPFTSYLTLIDKYSITLIVFDLLCTLYHATMGYWVNNDKSVNTKLKSRVPDYIMFFILLFLFILFNFIFFIWIIRVACKPRRVLEKQDAWIIVNKQPSFSPSTTITYENDRL